MPNTPVLAVHYSKTALTSTLVELMSACSAWEHRSPHMANFSLSNDAKVRCEDGVDYQRDVKSAIVQKMIKTPVVEERAGIILAGDMVEVTL
jgi:hypothetical protein